VEVLTSGKRFHQLEAYVVGSKLLNELAGSKLDYLNLHRSSQHLTFENLSHQADGLSQLELWANGQQRHEFIAYRLERRGDSRIR
jgi:hypothetical protein